MFTSFCESKLTLLKQKMFGTVGNLFAVFCCSGIELFVIMFTVLQKNYSRSLKMLRLHLCMLNYK